MVKTAYKVINPNGGCFSWVFTIINCVCGVTIKTLAVCGNSKFSGPLLQRSRFHQSNHSSSSHITWFPRKNYNKSGRRGAQEHKEKETEQEWNNMYWQLRFLLLCLNLAPKSEFELLKLTVSCENVMMQWKWVDAMAELQLCELMTVRWGWTTVRKHEAITGQKHPVVLLASRVSSSQTLVPFPIGQWRHCNSGSDEGCWQLSKYLWSRSACTLKTGGTL